MTLKRLLLPLLGIIFAFAMASGTADAATAGASTGHPAATVGATAAHPVAAVHTNSVRPAATAAPMDAHGCPYTALCVWPTANFQGTPQTYWACYSYSVDLFGPISYDNNQTPNTVAVFTLGGGATANTPGAPYAAASAFSSKTYIASVKPC